MPDDTQNLYVQLWTRCLDVSAERAQQLATTLLQRSQWFAVEPLPDDLYRVHVKPENVAMLLEDVATVKRNVYHVIANHNAQERDFVLTASDPAHAQEKVLATLPKEYGVRWNEFLCTSTDEFVTRLGHP